MISKGENSISSREEIKSLEISYLELSKNLRFIGMSMLQKKGKEREGCYLLSFNHFYVQ